MASSTQAIQSRTLLGVFSQIVGRYGIRSEEGEERKCLPIKSVPKFAPVSKEGMDLKEGRWGNLDASLSFLSCPTVQIMASSKGFLLCCADVTTNMTYFVCNPVTREYLVIPEPLKFHFSVAVGFVCKTSDADMSLSGTSFEIFRVKSKGVMTTLEVEHFSSSTGEWTEYFPVSPIPIKIQPLRRPAVVLNDLVMWKNATSMVVFDPFRHESVQVIPFPKENVIQLPEGTSYFGFSRMLGDSEGKIYFGRVTPLEFEVWLLGDMERGEWTLKHRVTFDEISRANADSVVTHFRICQFHPMDSELILVLFSSMPYWYNRVTGRLSVAGSDVTIGTVSYPYEWPFEPRSDESRLNV